MYYIILGIIALLSIFRFRRRKDYVALFHPYCDAGGGGERVLWCAVRAMQNNYDHCTGKFFGAQEAIPVHFTAPFMHAIKASLVLNIGQWPHLSFVVYTGDLGATKESILLRARQRFNVEVDPRNVEFIFLRLRPIVEARWYPRFTLVLQTLAGGILALEAICRFVPSVFIDSMGYPLSLPVFRLLGGAQVAAYVHYPTISCDMISLVERRESSYNNSDAIAQSGTLSRIKLAYYKSFAVAYGWAGRAASVVMVNGSWTGGHISSLWSSDAARLVFPPCDIESLLAIPVRAEEILASDRIVRILSIGQIRPEKNHSLQLEVLRSVQDALASEGSDVEVSLTIAGGCRHAEDEERVAALKRYAVELGVEKSVKWMLNVPYEDLVEELSSSMISIHTMINEHFGISVVEALAAGTIMVAHRSGGPKMDIVVPSDGKERVGYVAETREEFSRAISSILALSPSERQRIREAARKASTRFSEQSFDDRWNESVQPLMDTVAA